MELSYTLFPVQVPPPNSASVPALAVEAPEIGPSQWDGRRFKPAWTAALQHWRGARRRTMLNSCDRDGSNTAQNREQAVRQSESEVGLPEESMNSSPVARPEVICAEPEVLPAPLFLNHLLAPLKMRPPLPKVRVAPLWMLKSVVSTREYTVADPVKEAEALLIFQFCVE